MPLQPTQHFLITDIRKFILYFQVSKPDSSKPFLKSSVHDSKNYMHSDKVCVLTVLVRNNLHLWGGRESAPVEPGSNRPGDRPYHRVFNGLFNIVHVVT